MSAVLRGILTTIVFWGFVQAVNAEEKPLKQDAIPAYTHVFSGILEPSPFLVDSLAQMKADTEKGRYFWEFYRSSISAVSLRITDTIKGNMRPRTASGSLGRLFDTPEFWTRVSTPLYWQAGRRYLVMLRMPAGKEVTANMRNDPWEAITVIDLDETVREAAQREALAEYEAKAPARAWQREGGAIFPAAGEEDWDAQIAALKKDVDAGEMTDDDLFRRLGRPVASLKDDEGGGDTLVYAARAQRAPEVQSHRANVPFHYDDGREMKFRKYVHYWLCFTRRDGRITGMKVTYQDHEMANPLPKGP